MSLMDKMRAELIDIIEWVDDSRHTIVWRFPRYHNQIKQGDGSTASTAPSRPRSTSRARARSRTSNGAPPTP